MANLKGLLVYGAIGGAVLLYNGVTSADRDSSGAIIDGGSVDAFEIAIGDCFNDSGSSSLGDLEEITSVPAVPCRESHDNEVYAVFNLGVASYSNDEAMFELAFAGCLDRFDGFVGQDYQSSVLDIYAMYPTKESWSQLSDREVICAAFDMNGNKLQGSVKGLAL